MRDILMRQASW
ncbi:unnamed protein product [Allacma fusca]|uniref:Uncharacterized protein n=1 Tax=Allacma fusca TaxID=39272 RepID=A0A8J2JU09_9HEXA|nr:unnamed protein product [Allacma fusca]